MIREENSDLIPIDLVVEILSRLPARSIARCRCVSKLWRSILIRPYFTDLFLTRSSSRPPRLLFVVERSNDDCCFFTSPQKPIDESSSSSLLITADFHMKFPVVTRPTFCGHASGFMLFVEKYKVFMCNPSTGQNVCLSLPPKSIWGSNDADYFLGFDPIDKQFKLLNLTDRTGDDDDEKAESDRVMTLGTGNDSWRKIHCPLSHFPFNPAAICIDEILYYLAHPNYNGPPLVIVCFDARSEIFNYIYTDPIPFDYITKLINYKGKLGVITHDYDDRQGCLKLCLWVMNPKLEWSKYFSFCWENYDQDYLSVVGVTANDEFVLSTKDASKPFYVFYLNPKSKTIQRVEIKGFGVNHDHMGSESASTVQVFVDYIEDLNMLQHL